MVSQDSTSNSNSSILHQFIMSAQNQYGNNHHYNHAYEPSFNVSPNSHQPLGLLPIIQSLESSEINNHATNFMDLLGSSSDNDTNYQNQKLSLSLGNTLVNGGYDSSSGNNISYQYSFTPTSSSSNPISSNLYEKEAFSAAVSNSRYLKPAQSLLEEMVSVDGKTVQLSNEKYIKKLSSNSRRSSLILSSELKFELSNIELFSGKHELHVKLAKLISFMREVEIRYEKYYNHLEEAVSSFEMIAGVGAGNSYTALTLQAMSRHFCSLRDTIMSQIRLTRQEILQDMPKIISTDMSKLNLFDKESRKNRISLQQLGMFQSSRHAWRPIRGLPETSVMILRSWLFEHFLHPYPNDSEKLMLSSQTGLSKNQVSNWFINARVRLWKPMIEEMYKEEFAECSNESDTLVREGVSDSVED